MGMMQEFKEFAIKGNMIDLAVGVIIGGAFQKIIDSIVNDLIMPIIAALFGGKLDFQNMYLTLGAIPNGVANNYAALKAAGVPMLAYGNFLTILINFLLLAWVVFMMVKAINRIRRQTPAAPAAPAEDVVLLREIRDQLARRP